MHTIMRIKKLLPKSFNTKLRFTKIVFEDRCTLIIREPFIRENRTREQEIAKSEFKQHNIILSYYHYRPIIYYYNFSSNMVDIWSAKLLLLRNTGKIWKKIGLRFLIDLESAMQTKEFQMSRKKNWFPLLKSTKKLTVSSNSFSIGYLIYYKLVCLICSFSAYCM